MAATVAVRPSRHIGGDGFAGSEIPKLKTGLDEKMACMKGKWSMKRCANGDSCIEWSLAGQATALPLDLEQRKLIISIRQCLTDLADDLFVNADCLIDNECDTPPSYSESIRDSPPQYYLCAPPDTIPNENPICSGEVWRSRPNAFQISVDPTMKPDIDFCDTSTFRQAGGKNKKKKQAEPKWNGSEDEGNKEGGDGNEGGEGDGGGGGGAGGGSNNGDGGGGGDDGGGDDWNDWNAGKKKKGKKAKEEEKKKQEEEEKKKKEEEEAEKSKNPNPLSWADEDPGDEDWGTFTTWGAKKGKDKKKKGDDKPNGTSTFDEINLNDGTPKPDLSFGGAESKDGGFGSSFASNWGGSWNNPNKWDFNAADTGTTDIADPFPKSTKDTSADVADSAWSFGGNKKNKKKTTSSGFDFGDFGTINEGKEEENVADSMAGGTDDWGAIGKKDKKTKKKSAFEDTTEDIDLNTIGTAVDTPGDGTWSGWGTAGSKDKKKNKKAEDAISPPSPPAAAVTDVSGLDEWSSFGVKDKKKKGKKGGDEQSGITTLPGLEENDEFSWNASDKKDKKKTTTTKDVEKAEDTSNKEAEAENEWGSFGAKKDKKKPKKVEKEEPMVAEPERDPVVDSGWGVFGGKKDKKKAAKKDEKDDVTKTVTAEPEPSFDTEWGSFGGNKKEKDKDKKKKSMWDEPEKEQPIAEVTPEPDLTTDVGWGSFGPKKDKKKGKKDLIEEVTAVESEPVIDETPIWGATASKKDKKNKKGLISEVKDDPIISTDTKAADSAANDLNEDWMSWATDKKKDKKGKRNSLASSKGDDPPPPLDSIPTVPDIPDSSEIWGTSKKDKKGKKGKALEPESTPVPDPVVKEPEEDWSALSPKERRKKEREKKEREKAEQERVEKEEQERLEREEQERKEQEEREQKEQKEKEEKAALRKGGKKGKISSTEASKTKDLLAGSVPDPDPDPVPSIQDDWGSTWGIGKKDKKKGKKGMDFHPPPPAPTPPTQGLTPEPEEDPLEGDWGDYAPVKSKDKKGSKKPTVVDEPKLDKKSTKKSKDDDFEELTKKLSKDESKKEKEGAKEESAAKAAKSFWAGADTTSKTKSAEDKAKKDAKKDEFIVSEVEEEEEQITKKPAKDKLGSKLTKAISKDERSDAKLTKTTSKDEKGGKAGDAKKKGIIDDVAEEAATKGKDSKSKEPKDKESKVADFDLDNMFDDDDDEEEEQQDDLDTFGYWGSSKKTSGKKNDESKKEITNPDLTNQKPSLKKGAKIEKEKEKERSKEKELEDSSISTKADKYSTTSPPLTKSSKSTMSTTKSTTKSSVLDRVKEFEKKTKGGAKSEEPDYFSSVVDPEPVSRSTKKDKEKDEEKGKSTGKSKDKKSAASKPKDESLVDKKRLKGAVPGGFPELDMDDLLDMSPSDETPEPVEEKPTGKKGDKSAKTVKKSPKEVSKTKSPPTPPPEPKEDKTTKKERPKISKADASASWGFWGSAPKKETKKGAISKDDADISPPAKKEKAPATGLSRSKSTKTAKEKDREIAKSEARSSDSDKPKKAESRPPKSRGSSFGALFSGPPPSRRPSVRRNSTSVSGAKTTSRRQSVEPSASGLPSPPPEDEPEMSRKAAKVMGTGTKDKINRKSSTKGKSKAIPDPFPIDDDDVVMVSPIKDPIINAPIPGKSKNKSSRGASTREADLTKDLPDRSRSKPESTSKSKRQPRDTDEDVIMVDANNGSDGADVADGPDDLAFVSRPKLQRSNTASKRPEMKGGVGSFFGFGKNRRPSESIEKPRKKIIEDEELTPRKRTVASGGEDPTKRVRRSEKARRSEPPRNDREDEGFVYPGPADSGEEPAKAERRARRADKDRTNKDLLDQEMHAADERRAKRREAERSKRELREQEDKEARRAAREERRRKEDESRANRELEDEVLLAEPKPRSSRRTRETDNEDGSKNRSSRRKPERESTSRRKSSPREPATAKSNDPYAGLGNDHTSSWVKSQISDPAPPPPVEGTVFEEAPVLGSGSKANQDEAEDLLAEEDIRRKSHRKGASSRKSRYIDPVAEDQDSRRRRDKDKDRDASGYASPADEAGDDRYGKRRTDMGGVKLGSGSKTFDGRTGQGKRSSWLSGIRGAF